MADGVRPYLIFGLGFFAQSLFGMRMIIQWWLAEKKREAVSPSSFWILSLTGSALFLLYGTLRHDMVIIIGQLISYYIYVRNLQLKGIWQRVPAALRLAILAIPFIALFFTFSVAEVNTLSGLTKNPGLWFSLGMAGQLMLNLRFIYQLYHSELSKQSVLPGGFWWISLCGSFLLVTYSISRRDPVLLVAQGIAIVPYIRNIVLNNKKKKSTLLESDSVHRR